ncbi:MAG: hypothetical protein DRN68_08160 [Thaumarchaeota archaeon]|nr:MAG: hypothetical protein DRN68_08160 [Nitrososphaerota archaeon]
MGLKVYGAGLQISNTWSEEPPGDPRFKSGRPQPALFQLFMNMIYFAISSAKVLLFFMKVYLYVFNWFA